jgi:hypothetical protein
VQPEFESRADVLVSRDLALASSDHVADPYARADYVVGRLLESRGLAGHSRRRKRAASCSELECHLAKQVVAEKTVGLMDNPVTIP